MNILKKNINIFLILISLLLLTACPQSGNPAGQNGSNGISTGGGLNISGSAKTIIEGIVISKQYDKTGKEIETASIGATIYIEGTNIFTKSDTNGLFSVPNAPTEKTFYIVAKKINNGMLLKARTQVKKIPINQKSFKMENLFLKNTGTITGNVLLKEQSNFNGINVYLNACGMVTKTDTNGYFSLDEIPEGDYFINAGKSGYTTQRIKSGIKVTAGKTTSIENIILEPDTGINEYGKLTGKIINKDKPVAFASVSLISSDLVQLYATATDEAGDYNLDSIKPNSTDLMPDKEYQILVNKSGYTQVTDKISIGRSQSLQKNFTLNSSDITYGKLKFTILGCNNQPVNDDFNIKISDFNNNSTIINTKNTFQFTNLYPGKYILEISGAKSGIIRKIFNIDNVKVGTDGQAGDSVDLTINSNDCQNEINNIVFSGINLVNDKLKITLTPLDSSGQPVLTELTKDSFKIVDLKLTDDTGNINQLNASVDSIDFNQPDSNSAFKTVLGIDANETLKADDPNEIYKDAIKNFINNKSTNDLIAVYEINDNSKIIQDFTNQQDLLNTALNNITKGSKSWIYRSLLNVMSNLGLSVLPLSAPIKTDNRNIIVFTNGLLNIDDKNSANNVIQRALSLNLPVNVVNLKSINKDIAISGLQELAVKTGGVFLYAFDSSELKQIFENLKYIIKGNITINASLPLTNLQKGKQYTISALIEHQLISGDIISLFIKGIIFI